MTTVSDIYKDLFAGRRLTIALADRKAFDSLRVALCQQHQTPKLLLELTSDSLCASFDASQGIGTFWLGTPRKAKRAVAFEILSSEDIGETDAQV
jgi:hypothetical protein